MKDGFAVYMQRATQELFFTNKLNYLLVCVPLAIISNGGGWGDGITFTFSLIAICPLARAFGIRHGTVGGIYKLNRRRLVERVVWECHRNDRLHVRFKSWIITCRPVVFARLYSFEYAFSSWVRVSLWRHVEERTIFQRQGVMMNFGLLLLAVMGLSLPALLHFTHTELHGTASELALSRFFEYNSSFNLFGVFVFSTGHTRIFMKTKKMTTTTTTTRN